MEDLVVHQATDHRDCECEICGTVVPEGFVAIHHAFTEHKRSEYVRAYDADADEIRHRETLVDLIEEQVDLDTLLTQVNDNPERQPVSAD
ncbi:MAG: hypothetical protein R3324_02610 [Halobacteriales archaeon]|nr:hypothetical protein [Halobacteriales archaeon]